MEDSTVHAETPCPAADPQSAPGRRGFLRWTTLALGAVASVVGGLPIIGYFFGHRPGGKFWVNLGPVSSFPLQETKRLDFESPLKQPWDGITALTGVYARYEGKNEKNEDTFMVLSVNCAHLGCPVTWFQQSGLFMCPCHGGVYSSDGERASGPPPRGLYHCVWRVQDGQLQVQAPHYPTLQNPLVKKA